MKRKFISISLAFLSVILIGIYFYFNGEVFSEIKKIHPLYAIPIALLGAFSLYINGLFFKTLAKPFGVDVKEYFWLSVSGSFFNMITPFSGGSAVRAVYMKKKHNLNYSIFLATLFGNYIVVLMTSSFVAFMTFVAIYLQNKIFNLALSIIFAVIFIGTAILITAPHLHFKHENFITSKINKIMEGWHLITRHKSMIPKLVVLTLCNLFAYSLINKFAFAGLGIDINFTQAMYMAVVSSLAVFINITPSSIGVTEFLYLYSGTIMGASPGISLIVALVIRALNTLLLAILGPIANYMLANEN